MLTGTSIRLKSSVLCIYSDGDQRSAVMVPEGAIVKIISRSRTEDLMMDILWDGRVVAAFAVDILNRGEEVETNRRGRSSFA